MKKHLFINYLTKKINVLYYLYQNSFLISNKENEDFLNDSNKGIDMKLDSSFWYDRLEECSGILIGLNEKTETDFIHLGNTLDSNNEDIKNILFVHFIFSWNISFTSILCRNIPVWSKTIKGK